MILAEFPKIIGVLNPRFLHDGRIMLDIQHEDFPNEILKYCASPTDCEIEGKILFEKASQGMFGPIAPFDPQPIVGENALNRLRMKRNELLKNHVDPIATNTLRWNNLTESQQSELAAYRTALLDMPETYSNAQYIWHGNKYVLQGAVWPTPPSFLGV